MNVPGHTQLNYVKLKIYDSSNNNILDINTVESDLIHFTGKLDIEYRICLDYQHTSMIEKQITQLRYSLNFIDNTDIIYDLTEHAAKSIHFDAIEIELNKLLSRINQIRIQQDSSRQAEELYRNSSETHNRNVMYYNLLVCILVISSGVFQFMYIKQHFMRKKVV